MKTDANGVITELDVNVKNFAEVFAKPRVVKHTTLKTWILDPANVAGPDFQQICDYEPTRIRMVIGVIDSGVILCTSVPRVSPDISTASSLPETGRHLSVSGGNVGYELFGPDAFWINTISGGAVTRVTVTKEYC